MNRGAFDLTRIALGTSVSFNMLEWLALTYQLKVLDDPQLIDDVQVQNSLLLTASYSIIQEREPPKPEEPNPLEEAIKASKDALERAEALEKELENAKADKDAADARAEAAEVRATEAEARVKALEPKLEGEDAQEPESEEATEESNETKKPDEGG